MTTALLPQEWAKIQERGTYLGLATLIFIYKIFGIRSMHAVLYFVVGFYFIFSPSARRASLQFLRTVHAHLGAQSPWKKTPGWRMCYGHFMFFARTACDKLIVWMGHYNVNDLKFSGYDLYKSYQDEGRGCLLIVSHLGNIDICRAFAGGVKKMRLTVLVHNAHAPNFQKMMEALSRESSTIEMIEVGDITPDVVIRLRERIAAGENVAISGDRTPVKSTGRFEMLPFLGGDAPFAQGPFILADLLECPVFAIFNMRQGCSYHAFFHHMGENLKSPRAVRDTNLRQNMAEYVRLLEYYACAYPMQWFNFYQYWCNREE